MQKFIKLFTLTFAISAASLMFASCENNSKEHDQDMNANDSATSPDYTDSSINSDTGTMGGVNDMDPEGGKRIDKHEDGLNAGGTNNTGTGATTTGTNNTDTKNNGTREPNEYSSGNTSGQYNDPNATTTKSGTSKKSGSGK